MTNKPNNYRNFLDISQVGSKEIKNIIEHAKQLKKTSPEESKKIARQQTKLRLFLKNLPRAPVFRLKLASTNLVETQLLWIVQALNLVAASLCPTRHL